MKNKFFLSLAAGLLILSVLACSLGGNRPPATQRPPVNPPVTQPPVQPPPANALQVLSATSFTDDFGYFYVYGEVQNTSDAALENIEILVEARDANGASLLVDENGRPIEAQVVYPMLSILAPGDTSPFEFYLDTDTYGVPASYNVTVGNYELSDVTRADITYEGVQIVEGTDGYLYLTGELVNQGSEWAYIASLAGGVLDDSNAVLSADWSLDYASLLAPAGDTEGLDRTPFAISFPKPAGDATQWALWWDARVESQVTTYPLTIEVTNSYFDSYNDVHLIGFVTNNSPEPITTSLVAGLYSADGLCLDARYNALPVSIKPGESVPFDVSYFNVVDVNEQQASLVDNYTLQADYWVTYPAYYHTVSISSSNVNVTKDGASWTVSGQFTNNSDKSLVDVAVLVKVLDASNTLVGLGYTYVYPESGDSFASGAGGEFEVYLFLDPAGDLANYTVEVVVLGEYNP